jgi:hypothetical protein
MTEKDGSHLAFVTGFRNLIADVVVAVNVEEPRTVSRHRSMNCRLRRNLAVFPETEADFKWCVMIPFCSWHVILKELRDLSSRANYTNRATTACRQS